jgi:type III secretory pathway component EscV
LIHKWAAAFSIAVLILILVGVFVGFIWAVVSFLATVWAEVLLLRHKEKLDISQENEVKK